MAPDHITRILRDLRLDEGPLERAESWSSETWLSPTHVVKFHALGPPGRVTHEVRVLERLPAETLRPVLVASGWTDDHDWLVLEREPGEPLCNAWPSMDDSDRQRAIHEFGHALRAVHGVDPDGLVPPQSFGGLPVIFREEAVPETIRLLREYDGDRAVLDRAAQMAAEIGVHVMDPPDALVHNDLNVTNVLWDGRITALIDFEWAGAQARDVDLQEIVKFCRYPLRAVPEHLESITKDDDYFDVPMWLREAYPELFAADHLLERVTFYEISHWAQELRRDHEPLRAHAMQMLANVVDGNGAAGLLRR